MISLRKNGVKPKKEYKTNSKERKDLARKHGLCEICASEITDGPNGEPNLSRVNCYECYKKNSTERKAVYTLKRTNNICADCKKPAKEGSTRCEEHEIYYQKRKERLAKLKDKNKNKCNCGKPKFKNHYGKQYSNCIRCIIKSYERRNVFKFLKTGLYPGKRGRKSLPIARKKYLANRLESQYRPAIRRSYMKTHLDVKREKGRNISKGVQLNAVRQNPSEVDFKQHPDAEKLITDIARSLKTNLTSKENNGEENG